MDFSIWLLSLSIMSPVPSMLQQASELLFMAEEYSVGGIEHVLIIHALLIRIWVVSTFWQVWVTLS